MFSQNKYWDGKTQNDDLKGQRLVMPFSESAYRFATTYTYVYYSNNDDNCALLSLNLVILSQDKITGWLVRV